LRTKSRLECEYESANLLNYSEKVKGSDGRLAQVGVLFAQDVPRPGKAHADPVEQFGWNDPSEDLEHRAIEGLPIFVSGRAVLPSVSLDGRDPLDSRSQGGRRHEGAADAGQILDVDLHPPLLGRSAE